MAEATYYQILGLQAGAPTSEIKRRYRVLAKQYHPDNHGDTKMMARINDAYTVLADPKSRYKYDQMLNSALVRAPQRPPNPWQTPPQQHHVAYTGDNAYKAPYFSLWKLGLIGGACAMLALVGIITSLGHQKAQHLATANVSHQQSTTTQTQSASTPATSSNNASLSGQLAQEEAKLKQEEALANTFKQQAQQAMTQSRQGTQDTEQQSVYTTVATQPVSAPDAFPILQAMRYGALKGTYHYAVSYVSADGTETQLGPISYGITAYYQRMHVSNIPTSSNTSVTQVKLYRTFGNGSAAGPYYLVATLPNGTTTYNDNTSDRNLPTWTAKYE